MQKIIIFSLFSAFLFSGQLSLAQSYPATCPTEAQGILSAVGGCSTIDCNTYSNICEKCCADIISTSNPIVYALLAVIIIALVVWQILKRRKLTKTISNS